MKKRLVVALKILVLVATFAISINAMYFYYIRSVVFGVDGDLWKLGQHFVIGYDSIGEVEALVKKGAIGGIYLTRKNVAGKTIAEIRSEIDDLQALQASYGRRPLIISTDQEGGVVQRLSPPLEDLSSLASVVFQGSIDEDKLSEFSNIQGKGLQVVGINLNFSPVVDLNEGLVNDDDRYTRIYLRSIDSDPALVSKVAFEYCWGLAEFDVRCTLKHFPGLGRVSEDTHLSGVEFEISRNELMNRELLPYRQLFDEYGMNDGVVMVSHAVYKGVDDLPASMSKQIITDLLRDELGFQGVTITDDISMGAIVHNHYGVEQSAIMALEAGGDLVLISYKHDLYYFVMANLLKQIEEGNFDPSVLDESEKRLNLL